LFRVVGKDPASPPLGTAGCNSEQTMDSVITMMTYVD
jgi:hypothetical protein